MRLWTSCIVFSVRSEFCPMMKGWPFQEASLVVGGWSKSIGTTVFFLGDCWSNWIQVYYVEAKPWCSLGSAWLDSASLTWFVFEVKVPDGRELTIVVPPNSTQDGDFFCSFSEGSQKLDLRLRSFKAPIFPLFFPFKTKNPFSGAKDAPFLPFPPHLTRPFRWDSRSFSWSLTRLMGSWRWWKLRRLRRSPVAWRKGRGDPNGRG